MILLICFMVLYAFIKSIKDTISFHHSTSIFTHLSSFWNPSESWKFKYKNNDPLQGNRFFLSSTWLVSLTDAWHLLENIQSWMVCLALGFAFPQYNQPLLTAVALKLIYIIVFHVWYTYIWYDKKEIKN